jgi:hypothetical protein
VTENPTQTGLTGNLLANGNEKSQKELLQNES